MQLFPRWTNNFAGIFLIGIFLLVFSLSSFLWYYGSPYYTDVGYAPVQPVPYSHKLHAGDMGIELYKAELALKYNLEYIQDKDLELK